MVIQNVEGLSMECMAMECMAMERMLVAVTYSESDWKNLGVPEKVLESVSKKFDTKKVSKLVLKKFGIKKIRYRYRPYLGLVIQ